MTHLEKLRRIKQDIDNEFYLGYNPINQIVRIRSDIIKRWLKELDELC